MSQMESPAQCHIADEVGTCVRRLALRDITNVHANSVDPDDYMSDVSMIGLSDEDDEDNGGECATLDSRAIILNCVYRNVWLRLRWRV